jgi:DNA-binding response OmpR family regulator
MKLATERGFDLLLLDLVLPGCHGLEILRAVQQIRPNQPVIILTALGDEHERVQGLRLGADDYVVKPFSVKELLARVEAVLRRSPERPLELHTLELPHATLDLSRAEIRFRDGKRAELSEKELELIRYLARNSGRAISRDELLQRVWQLSPRGLATRTIDMHVMRIREKLRDDPENPQIVLTVRGKGYMFSAPKGN